METQHFALTDSPQDVVDGLGLQVGQAYAGQFRGHGALLFGTFADVPERGAVVNRVESLESIAIIPETGMGVWVWLKSAKSGYLVVNEIGQ